MAVKKYKFVIKDACLRCFWDGRAINIEKINDEFQWEKVMTFYKWRGKFQLKRFSYHRYRDRSVSVSYYTTDYDRVSRGIEDMERISKITIPEDIREYLDAYETLYTLSKN